MGLSPVLSSLHHKVLRGEKKTYPEPKIEKDGTGYKIPTSEKPKKRKNRAGSKVGFFCLTVVLQTKGFWK